MNQEIVFFHERARKVFFALFNQFRQAAASLDRQRDENVFQQMRSMYILQLRQHLLEIAMEVMRKNGSLQSDGDLHHAITHSVDEYVHEFEQKIDTL